MIAEYSRHVTCKSCGKEYQIKATEEEYHKAASGDSLYDDTTGPICPYRSKVYDKCLSCGKKDWY
jgi:hypothetical protein